MKIIIYLIAILISSTNIAQKGERIIAKAVYHIRYTNTKTGKTVIDDSCVLNVSKSYSYFYSLGRKVAHSKLEKKLEESLLQKESVNAISADLSILKKTLGPRFFKKYTNNQVYIVENIGEQLYGYLFDSTLFTKWIITPDTNIINGFHCTKAYLIDDSLKLKLTVWFCPEISISDGPLGYYGLPGIIVKSEGVNGWYTELTSFSLMDSKSYEEIKIDFSVVSAKDFKNAKKANAVFFKEGGTLTNSDGTTVDINKKN